MKLSITKNKQTNYLVLFGLFWLGIVSSYQQYLFTEFLNSFDGNAYIEISDYVLNSSSIANDLSVFPVGYPLLIALLRSINDSVFFLALAQHGFRILVPLVTFWLLKDIDYRLSIIFSLILSISPITAHQAHQVITGSFFTGGYFIFFLLAYRLFLQGTRAKPIFLLALLFLGFYLAYIRPLTLFFLPILLLIFFSRTRSIRQLAFLSSTLVVIFFTFSVVNWELREILAFPGRNNEEVYVVSVIREDFLYDENGTYSQLALKSFEKCNGYGFHELDY